MRIAVLILASHAPRALFATASYFAPSDVDIFVHVDAKVDLAEYLAQAGPWPPRVKFLEARRRVYWGGFSMVESTLDLSARGGQARDPTSAMSSSPTTSLPVHSLDGFFGKSLPRPRRHHSNAKSGLMPAVKLNWYDMACT